MAARSVLLRPGFDRGLLARLARQRGPPQGRAKVGTLARGHSKAYSAYVHTFGNKRNGPQPEAVPIHLHRSGASRNVPRNATNIAAGSGGRSANEKSRAVPPA